MRQGAPKLCMQDRQVGFALVQQFGGRGLLPFQFPGSFKAPFGQPDTGLQCADIRFGPLSADAVIRAIQPHQHTAGVDNLADLHGDPVDTRLDLGSDGRVIQTDNGSRRRIPEVDRHVLDARGFNRDSILTARYERQNEKQQYQECLGEKFVSHNFNRLF